MNADNAAIYSLSFDAEQLMAVYGALTTYLKILCQQESQDFETITRVSVILSEIKPQAVGASQEIASRVTVS